MAIYTVGRRRVVIALLLTAALLLTLDLRGNPVLDSVRDGFTRSMAPVERAADVVTNPVQRTWNAYSNYDDLERENDALRDQLERQRGTQAAAEASIIDYNLLLALNNLPALTGIETAKAQVVGGASNNIDQIVEINKGSNDGIAVGMPVVNQAGLIGKITQVNASTSKVMLVTDPRYSIAVEILGGTGAASALDDLEPSNTTPSGRTEEENDAVIDAAVGGDDVTVVATPADVFAENDVDLPQAGDLPDPGVVTPVTTTTTLPPAVIPGEAAPVTTTIPAVTEPDELEKEFGVLEGRGQGRPTQIRFLQDVPSLAVLEVGDLIETAGGSESLAPPNIPVGRVINRADRPGVAGPLLDIELNADLDKLNFVRVVLFRPLSEVAE
ncbi:MAG: rod shape-determining protein MreC [Ilumatobacter sp.]